MTKDGLLVAAGVMGISIVGSGFVFGAIVLFGAWGLGLVGAALFLLLASVFSAETPANKG